MIYLDTSVLSMVFRRVKSGATPHAVVGVFSDLVRRDEEMRVPGVVYQELLSGVRTDEAFQRLEQVLGGFRIVLADIETHRRAAQVRSFCQSGGISAASFDCLVAAHSLVKDAELFTLDDDFKHMAPLVGLKLYSYGT
jgi:predicted nucleic acid-binding protein